MRSAIATALCFLLYAQTSAHAEPQLSPASAAPLKILVLAGQNAANNLKRNTAVQPILEVRDINNRPAPAVVVRLTAPSEGPGVRFANGSSSIALVTETDGRVAVEDMTPRGIGAFEISVEASMDDRFATATIRQENSDHPAPAALGDSGASRHFASSGKHLSKTTVLVIVAGVAAAAAVGLALGLRSGGSSNSNVSIGVGTPTVGAPK